MSNLKLVIHTYYIELPDCVDIWQAVLHQRCPAMIHGDTKIKTTGTAICKCDRYQHMCCIILIFVVYAESDTKI